MASSSVSSGFTTGVGPAVLQYSLDKLTSLGILGWREIYLILNVDGELGKLQRSLLKVQELVDRVNCNPLRFYGGSDQWAVWFKDMRRLSYDADALLDRVSLHLSKYCAQNSVNTPNQEQQVRSMILSNVFTQLRLPREIANMHRELDALSSDMEGLVMNENPKSDSRTESCVMVKTLVGRGDDKKSIVGFLGKICETSNFSVLSVVGMVGVGKTAVAIDVYNGVDGVDFALKIWVSVSVEFDAVRITKSMIEYASLCPCNLSDLESVQQKLQMVLSEKKFLLVLDDYWSEKCHDWDVLSGPFRSGSRGSKVVVTTRSKKVAAIVGSSATCELEVFSEVDDCWKLIKQSAAKSAELYHDLELVGKEIAKKCKGVPLVATTLGHMLRSKSTEEEWCSVLKNELWEMPQDNNIFLRSMLSYLHLAPHLQKCFAYCSIFPQNYEFEMEELIFLWIGEGFIQPNGARTLEDLAKDCFNDLCLRFFFKKCTNASGETRYKMHDLIHGLAWLVSKDICFHSKHDKSNLYPLFGNSCHLSLLHESTQSVELKASVKNERLRTFLLMRNGATQLDPKLFSHLKFLKVLGLSRTGLSVLIDGIDQLEYLRYLNLSGNPIRRLPKSMCKLAALQILKLTGCCNLRVLPEEMSSLMSLRRLEIDKGMFQRMPPQLGNLTSLHHLSVYAVSNRSRLAELNSLNGLRGALCIKNLDASSAGDAEEAELGSKPSLDKLELEWTSGLQNHTEQAEVLAKLQPSTNLKELVIRNYCGRYYPTWLSDASHHFTSIHLQGLEYCASLPPFGNLPFLKSFAISSMPCLEMIDRTFYGANNAVKFPSLKSFELRDMSKLKKWEYGSNIYMTHIAMPCLVEFAIDGCPLLSSLPPNLRMLRHDNPNVVRVTGCPGLPP